MSSENPIFDELNEIRQDFVDALAWSSEASDYEKLLVHGNLTGFVGYLAERFADSPSLSESVSEFRRLERRVVSMIDHLQKELRMQIDELKQALADENVTIETGFNTIADSMTELASDVSGLNQKIADLEAAIAAGTDLTAAIAAVKAESQTISEKTSSTAQAIRDAIPTPAAEPSIPASDPASAAPVDTAPSADAPPVDALPVADGAPAETSPTSVAAPESAPADAPPTDGGAPSNG